MAGTAVSGGLAARRTWRPAVLVDRRAETRSAHTLVFDVDGWPSHFPGQHLDLRLTAEDGYQAARSYSLAAPPDGQRVEITVQRTEGGEVSPFLTDDFAIGDAAEVRGPLGGWFVWRPEQKEPILLVAGGSGVVPLMSMIRARKRGNSDVEFRLLYSVRSPEDRLFAEELEDLVQNEAGVAVTWIYTRTAPPDSRRSASRLSVEDLRMYGWSPEDEPTTYVCGPTSFVESVATALISIGHDPSRIKTERFGGS
ncbi:MAG TPA: ferredoxin reductase [Actinomycetes bacterium]|nr:ferredoxin reductase [Actinomycetes bacterium]